MSIFPLRILLTVALVLLASSAFGQQTYVTRYDAYVGYAFLDSPKVNLFENGFAAQVGFRPKTWYSFGFDYSYSRGDLSLTPNLLPVALQQQLGAQLGQLIGAGLLPQTYTLTVPANSHTQTFAVGPQLAYRHLTHVTLFLRPVFAGAIHESATPQAAASDFFAQGVVKELAPTGKKTDTTWFLGFGGGFDILFTKHFAWRVQADLVYDHLFNDLLQDGRFTTRFSVGPAFNFGRNIKE
ncbi:conserved exported hypothetical protein [Candidatus Sulfopaludibacter sp. SbA4]|nr:conserved exported hypothetical protein [Candidatus Sulfopaludibacter sp. SbA4]